MTDFVDYDLIETDAANLISNANLGFKKVIINAEDVDFVFENAPLADIRTRRVLPEALGGRNYYSTIVLEVEIGAVDMTNRRASATIRNDLINATQRLFQDNPRFSNGVDTVILGNVELETVQDESQGAFIASAVVEIHVKLYTNG